jgi:transcriptional regulator with XRE-family HTH domain
LAGFTQKQVAEDLGWSLSKVIRQETGAQTISTADVMALVHYYQIADPGHVDFLLGITRAKEQVWWWDEYRETYPKRFVEFLAYEDSATSIRQFQMIAVPGLLQTELYARTLFNAEEEPQVAALALRIRLRRQEILSRQNGADMQFILDEAVVHRVVGGQDIMLDQLRHLRELNTLPHISIQIVPFTAGANAAMNGSFAILDFSPVGPNNPGVGGMDVDYVVNVEGPMVEALVYDNPETTSSYVEAFYGIRDIATSKEEANRLLDMRIDAIRASLARSEDP